MPASTLLSPALSDGLFKYSETGRLATLGCWALRTDPYGDVHGPDTDVWNHLLPVLARTNQSVHDSIAVFGAVYETRFLRNKDDLVLGSIASLYSKSLKTLQQEVCLSVDVTPAVISCVLLACVESLQSRPLYALTHMKGARCILVSQGANPRNDQHIGATPAQNSVARQGSPPANVEDELALLLEGLSLQSAAFELSGSPELPPERVTYTEDVSSHFHNIGGASSRLVQLLRNCYSFTASAVRWKYMPPGTVPRELGIQQGRHISALSLWLKRWEEHVFRRQQCGTPYLHRTTTMLRAQCLIALIYVSTILSPYETEYDRYASFFQQIIEDVTNVQQGSNSPAAEFRPGYGIIQPILLTALKYRHSGWRRKALSLLKHSAVEGPWFAYIEAALAERAIEAEEKGCEDLYEEILPEHIPDSRRVSEIRVSGRGARGSSKTVIKMRRCKDVEFMISGQESWRSRTHWDVREEVIDSADMVGPVCLQSGSMPYEL